MAFLIAGHMRSGTSILRSICQSHPALQVTREFGNFSALNVPFRVHAYHVGRVWWRKKRRGLLPSGLVGQPPRRLEMLHNLGFVSRYLAQVYRAQDGVVNTAVIDRAMRRLYPEAHEVGDKHPDYAEQLEELSREAGIRCIFIYRDPRDVASSTVEKTRGPWRRGHADVLREPGGIAGRWVRMMEAMQRCADRLLVIRYEDFVSHPGPTLKRLGEWLQVDPSGFDPTRLRTSSIGKYREGLTAAELSEVNDVAGPVMLRYGYTV